MKTKTMNNVTAEDIIAGLRDLGINSNSTILVHSAMSSFGHVEGGANTVIQALLNTVSDGNVIVPTLTGTANDGPDRPPIFDVRSTPCWTGIIPETFRKREGALRSLHPTHSVSVIGRDASYITGDHVNSITPCDEHSPYYINALMKGFIVLIGVDFESNTTVHCCEELAGVPYHLQKAKTNMTMTGYDGSARKISNYLHDWDKPMTDFNVLAPVVQEHNGIRKGKIGNSTILVIDAEIMITECVKVLKQHPLFMLV